MNELDIATDSTAVNYAQDIAGCLGEAIGLLRDVRNGQATSEDVQERLADLFGGVEAGVMGLSAAIGGWHPQDSVESTQPMAVEVRDALLRSGRSTGQRESEAFRAAFPLG